MDTLVPTEWLSQQLDAADLVILDCSVYQVPGDDGGFHNVSGRAEYEFGHIPTAGFADLKNDFTDVAVYTASLQEWAADPANPMVSGTT